jgi:hypothetical protein|tara:strand:+ start:587 stop:868 length:282 start_codon:yes stop_codon:yes gene_type:complete
LGVCDRRIYYLVLGTHPVIKPGNIVYRVRRGGFIHDYPVAVKNRVGLVIKEIKEKGTVPQYYVQFDKETPKWFYQHDLQRIGGERSENDKFHN